MNLRNNDTVIISRSERKDNLRFYNESLILDVVNTYNEYKNKYKRINICFATNPKNIMRIMQEIKDGRSKNELRVLNVLEINGRFTYVKRGSVKLKV